MTGSLSSANASDLAAARRRALPPSRMRTWPAAGSGANGPDHRGRGSNPARNGQDGALLLKKPLVSLNLHAGPSTSKNLCKSVLNFMFKPLSLIDLYTRGPE
jgi:hypothetical protein